MNTDGDMPFDTRDMKHPMITADTLLPSQYVDMLRAYGETSSPEKRLWLAILEQAANEYQLGASHNRDTCTYCLRYQQRPNRCRRRERFAEARNWFIEERNPNRTFSYEWICNALGIDADWLRAGILAMDKTLPRRAPANLQYPVTQNAQAR